MFFSKLFNLFRHQFFVAAVKQAAVNASISTYFRRPCLFLGAVILLPETGIGNWYHFLIQFCGTIFLGIKDFDFLR